MLPNVWPWASVEAPMGAGLPGPQFWPYSCATSLAYFRLNSRMDSCSDWVLPEATAPENWSMKEARSLLLGVAIRQSPVLERVAAGWVWAGVAADRTAGPSERSPRRSAATPGCG